MSRAQINCSIPAVLLFMVAVVSESAAAQCADNLFGSKLQSKF